MKLLDKKSVASQVAAQKKIQIDEGISLSRKVDALRQTLVVEQGKLDKFRSETVALIQKEIDDLIRIKDNLTRDITTRREELEALQKPLDQKWDELHAAEAKCKEWETELLGRHTHLNQLQEEVESIKKAALEDQDRAKVLTQQTTLALEDADRKVIEATKTGTRIIANAQKVMDDALAKEREVVAQEEDMAARERWVNKKEKENEELAQELEVWAIQLKDREEVYARNINRLGTNNG